MHVFQRPRVQKTRLLFVTNVVVGEEGVVLCVESPEARAWTVGDPSGRGEAWVGGGDV